MAEEQYLGEVLPESETTVELEEAAERMLETRYITPENAKFFENGGGFLSLTYEDKEYSRVNVYLMFPFSEPEKYISIRESDEKAGEIAIIQDLALFPEEQKGLIRAQLNLRYFTPKIKKLISIKEEHGFSYWDVLTDRGAARFTVAQGGVVKISTYRVIITDVDGNRFEISDYRSLSAKELRMVDLYL